MKKHPKKNIALEDKDDRDIIEAYERGEFKPVAAQKQMKRDLIAAANAYLKKEARINIRISESDLMGLKHKAAEEGLPYQTFIASILHKFVSGRLKSSIS